MKGPKLTNNSLSKTRALPFASNWIIPETDTCTHPGKLAFSLNAQRLSHKLPVLLENKTSLSFTKQKRGKHEWGFCSSVLQVILWVQIEKFLLPHVCYYTARGAHGKLAACFLGISIVMTIHCGSVMGGELHTADRNYRSFHLSALFFVWELKISIHHFLWWSGMENIGSKVDIYLAMSPSITVITTTSYLSGKVHIFPVRHQHPLSLHGALHGWNIPSSQAKQEGFGSVGSHGGRKKQREPSGKRQ